MQTSPKPVRRAFPWTATTLFLLGILPSASADDLPCKPEGIGESVECVLDTEQVGLEAASDLLPGRGDGVPRGVVPDLGPDVPVREGYSKCPTTYLIGHGERVTQWTPLMVVNSPYGGSAVATAGRTISTSFRFGTGTVTVGSGWNTNTAVALPANGGESVGFYVLLTWEHRHFKRDDCDGPGRTVDEWFVQNYTPRNGVAEKDTFDLTGASPETDADNLLVPQPDPNSWQAEYPFMAVNFRYEGGGDHTCTSAGGITFSTEKTELYTLEVQFVAEESGTHVGVTRATSQSNAYTYTLPYGHCWNVSYPSGAGKTAAFQYAGPANAAKVDRLEWVAPEPSGCDALDIVEAALPGGRYDWARYRVEMEATGATHGDLTMDPSQSDPFSVHAKSNSFQSAVVDPGENGGVVRAFYDLPPNSPPFDGFVEFDVDFEYDDPIGTSFLLDLLPDVDGRARVMGVEPPDARVAGVEEEDPNGNDEDAVEFLATPEDSNLRVRVVATTSPDRFKTLEAVVTPSILASHGGNLLNALESLFLAYPSDQLVSRLTCGNPGPSAFTDFQHWTADAQLSTSEIPVAEGAATAQVDVHLVA